MVINYISNDLLRERLRHKILNQCDPCMDTPQSVHGNRNKRNILIQRGFKEINIYNVFHFARGCAALRCPCIFVCVKSHPCLTVGNVT